jgi:TPR repeat protein
MRISSTLCGVALAAMLGVAGPALGLDTKASSSNTDPAEALRFGLNSYKSGNAAAAVEALSYAASKGLPSAQWKLGQMFATGDGVDRDEYRAFELFTQLANDNADAAPRDPSAPYVADAFVRLGSYYRRGIADTPVKADPVRARQFFSYAASYFGDATAQLNLAHMLYVGEGGERDLVQAARWANLAADKGNAEAKLLLVDISLDLTHKHLEGDQTFYNLRQATQWAERASEYGSIEGQALFGHLLFEGDGIAREPVEGLMYLTIALARATTPDLAWIRDMHEAARSAATPEEWAAAKIRADEWLAANAVKATSTLTQ